MPLSIIRNDITRVEADAIVNTANPQVAVGRGSDYAIYKAAGMDQLIEARKMIGEIMPGQTAVTPAYGLSAKYIIHTVGPAWMGGTYGERETVAECYRNCLSEAVRLECETVAFPLISTGTYGFPKDEALDIAIREISEFLESHEMDVELVVYDRESFGLSSELFADIRSYIDDAEIRAMAQAQTSDSYYNARMNRSLPLESAKSASPKGRSRRLSNLFNSREAREDEVLSSFAPDEAEKRTLSGYNAPEDASFSEAPEYHPAESADSQTRDVYTKREIDDALAHLIRNKDESFQQKLFGIIDSRGLSDPEVYKKANIDRKLFSKIRSNVDYKPTKKTAVAFAIALGLNLDETTDLLRSAGLSLSPSNSFDIIIRYCIEHRITNIHEINCILFEFDQMLLGA